MARRARPGPGRSAARPQLGPARPSRGRRHAPFSRAPGRWPRQIICSSGIVTRAPPQRGAARGPPPGASRSCTPKLRVSACSSSAPFRALSSAFPRRNREQPPCGHGSFPKLACLLITELCSPSVLTNCCFLDDAQSELPFAAIRCPAKRDLL